MLKHISYEKCPSDVLKIAQKYDKIFVEISDKNPRRQFLKLLFIKISYLVLLQERHGIQNTYIFFLIIRLIQYSFSKPTHKMELNLAKTFKISSYVTIIYSLFPAKLQKWSL